MADDAKPAIDLASVAAGGLDLDDTLAWALIEASPDGVVVTDAAGTMLVVNRQIEAMFGVARDHLVGKAVEELLPHAQRERHVAHRRGYLAAPRSRPMGEAMELWARRMDGAEFPVEVSLSPCPTARGQLVIAAVRDVTARRAAEQHVRNVNHLLDGISEAVYMVDPDTLRFTYVNEAACSQTLYSREELLAGGPRSLSPDLDMERSAREVAPLLRGEVARRSVMSVLRRRDGSEFPVEVDLSFPYALRGQTRQLVAIVRDVS